MAQLSAQQALAYAHAAGFTGSSAYIITAIAGAESGYSTTATHRNTDGSTDRGILQINSVAHAEVSDVQAFNPQSAFVAAYKISAQGANFSAWTTYTSGAYTKYLMAEVGTATAVQQAASNTYPVGQCTWYACQRYKQISGYYVPWKANAAQWSLEAFTYGWVVSDKSVAPSIVVLQPGIQGADTTYGHVAIVESINGDGSLRVSTQNWGGVTYPNTSIITLQPGQGVSYITAPGASLGTLGGSTPQSSLQSIDSTIQAALAVKDAVSSTLQEIPGLYGICLALDEAEQYVGYQNVASGQYDVAGILRSVALTAFDNAEPVAIRMMLFSAGLLLFFLLLFKLVEPAVREVLSVAGTVAKVAA